MARPTKLTKRRAERIVEAVRAGAPRHVAATAGGVARSTLQDWIARGEVADAREPYKSLAATIREAEAEREIEALQNIRRAAHTDWRADAWWLEHAREGYGRRQSVEVSGPGGAPVAVEGTWDLTQLTDKELAALQAMAEKAAGGD